MFQWNSRLCVSVGESRNEKYTPILSLNLESEKAGGH
jgi:hypothetical protein